MIPPPHISTHCEDETRERRIQTHRNTSVIEISSTEDETDTDIDDARPRIPDKNQMNVKANAVNKNDFQINCVRGECKELFQCWDALIFHATSYHAKGIKIEFHCHLCDKPLSTKYVFNARSRHARSSSLRKGVLKPTQTPNTR